MRSPLGVPPRCTGIAAHWCPRHGTCICIDQPDLPVVVHISTPMNNVLCPLHGILPGHPMIPYATPEGADLD